MTTRVKAVYENGVLRPTTRLPLSEGETVEVTIQSQSQAASPVAEERIRRIRSAKTFDEWMAAADAAAALESNDGYDLCAALNENRRRSGERLLYPPEEKGKTW